MGLVFFSGVVMPTSVAGAHLGSQSMCLGPGRDPVIVVGSCCFLPSVCGWLCPFLVIKSLSWSWIFFLYRLRPRRDYHCGICERFQMNWFQFGCPAPTIGIFLVLIFPKLVRGCLCGRHSFEVVPGPLVRYRASGPVCSWSNEADIRQHS